MIDKIKDFIFSRKQAYQSIFNGPKGEIVLSDLARFCRACESTAHNDPHMSARLDGRREVFLRIQQHTQLSQDDLWKLLGGK